MRANSKWRTAQNTVPIINFNPPFDERIWAPLEKATESNCDRGFISWTWESAPKYVSPWFDIPLLIKGMRVNNELLLRLLTVRTEWSRK